MAKTVTGGKLQGKAWWSTSIFRDRQPNDALPDVQTLATFERQAQTSVENVILTLL